MKIKEERNQLEAKVRNEMSAELEATMQQVVTLQSALEDMRQQLVSAQEKHSV